MMGRSQGHGHTGLPCDRQRCGLGTLGDRQELDLEDGHFESISKVAQVIINLVRHHPNIQ